MPMQAESLEVLEKAAVAPAQARAIVRAIEIEIAGATDTLATKQDLAVLKQDLGLLRQELKQDLAMLENRLQSRMDAGISALAAAFRTEMAQQGGEVRAELHRSIGGVIRQMYMAILGQMAVLMGFAYFFATNLR
jgi:hypothetical protein